MVWRLLTTLVLLVTCPLALQAQPRPGAFSTLTATTITAPTITGSTSITTPALTVTGSGASALDVTGGINAGTGNVGIVGTDGRIPAISSTYFASLSGANLTAIPETAITDGSLLARVAANEVLTGQYRASAGLIVGASGFPGATGGAGIAQVNAGLFAPLNFYDSTAATDEKWTQIVEGGGITRIRFVNDAGTLSFDPFLIERTGYNVATTTVSGTVAHVGALVRTPIVYAGALVNGNNNNLSPTGLSTAATVVFASAGGSTTITGLAAQANGFTVRICTDGFITFAHDDSNSSDANRFFMSPGTGTNNLVTGCTLATYDTAADGAVGKWRLDAW